MRAALLIPCRLRVLAALALADKPVKARDLAEMVGLKSASTVAQHVSRLAAAGLAEITPAGYVFVKVPQGMAVLASGELARVVWSDLAEERAA